MIVVDYGVLSDTPVCIFLEGMGCGVTFEPSRRTDTDDGHVGSGMICLRGDEGTSGTLCTLFFCP